MKMSPAYTELIFLLFPTNGNRIHFNSSNNLLFYIFFTSTGFPVKNDSLAAIAIR